MTICTIGHNSYSDHFSAPLGQPTPLATLPTDLDLVAPNHYGLSHMPILAHKPHPKGIIRIRGVIKLVEQVSLMNAPAPSVKAGDYGQLGAWLLRRYTVLS